MRVKPLSHAKPCVFTSMVAPGVAKVRSVSLVSGPRSGKAVGKKCTRLSRELDLHFKNPPRNFLYRIEEHGSPYNPPFYPSIKCFFFFFFLGLTKPLFGVLGNIHTQEWSPFYRGYFWVLFWGPFFTYIPIL